jgi:predicted Ser/Thr protein kinase
MRKCFFCFLFTFYLVVRDVLLPAVVAQSGITQTTATLSEARYWLAAASSGDLVIFGGGLNATGPSDRVDIYNVTNVIWTTATLSIPRRSLAATSSGNLVFFGGGQNNGSLPTVYSQVDMYNVSDGSWSTATLSQPRYFLVATSVGNLVLFGGGLNSSSWYSNVADIYNVTNNTWTTATLSQARYGLAATSVADRYALFAGGYNGSSVSNVVDIFDSLYGTWNTTTLSQGRNFLAAASLGNLAFFGGGDNGSSDVTSNLVDIYNSSSQEWSTATLSQNRTLIATASIGDIVAFGGGYNGSTTFSIVDIYNATSKIWFTTNLSQNRKWLVATSSTNEIFFGGGLDNSSISGVSNTVDIFFIPLPPTPLNAGTTPLSPPAVSSTTTSGVPSILPSLPSAVSGPTQSAPFSPQHPNPSTVTVPSSLDSALIGGLIGGIVGTLLVVAGIVVLVILLRKKQKQKKSTQTANNDDEKTIPVESDENGAVLESWQQTVRLENDITALTYAQTGTETLRGLSPGQIPLNELEIGTEIGNGNYGRVCVGKWKRYQVALKFCQNKGKMEEFLREANLMISLPPHPNVVRMYGVSVDGTQPIIVLEYCTGGSLDKLLFDTEEHISDEQKIRWVHEIALGMCHLHKHNIVHRDLAARNILLSQPNLADAQPKIADFGMSRVLQQNIEGRTSNFNGPIRWMAPESLAKQVYSKKSDVWMYGILIYEIVARREPHTDKDPNEAAVRIRDEGLTPTIPSKCPPKLRELMQLCWKMQPEQRPSFESICAMLEQ